MIFVFNFNDHQMTLKQSLIDYSNDYKYSIDYIIDLFKKLSSEIPEEFKEEFHDIYQELCENGDEEDFKLLGREIIRRFNAKMRRFSEEDLEFVAEVNGIYVMIYLHNCPIVNELRPWVFSIILREDLDDFGDGCDDVDKLHNLFK